MNHEERKLFSKKLSDKIIRTHPDVILSCVYGSTAKITDTEWSDLDMIFIVENENKVQGKSFIYKDIVINYQMVNEGELEKTLTIPTMSWPFWMGVLNVLKIIYGDSNQLKRWFKMGYPRLLSRDNGCMYLSQNTQKI